MADYTATAHVFPSANDVVGSLAAGWGKTVYEQNMADYLASAIYPYNFVKSGGKLPASSANLNITVPAIVAFIAGRYVSADAQSITVGASVTTYLYLKLSMDSNSNISTVKYETNTTGTQPSNSVIIGTLVSSGSAITSRVDRRLFQKTGIIEAFSGGENSVPAGAVLCYGQAISRTTYPNLSDMYARDSYPYGTGDGSTTFNVPDLRGRVAIGKDNMGGSAASRITSSSTNGANSTTLGGAGGAQTHTLSTSEMPSHTHTTSSFYPIGADVGYSAGGEFSTIPTSGTGSAGSGGAHSNTQPWVAENYIVWT